MKEVIDFISRAIFGHFVPIFTGSVFTAILTIWMIWAKTDRSKRVLRWLTILFLFGTLFVAFFLPFRDISGELDIRDQKLQSVSRQVDNLLQRAEYAEGKADEFRRKAEEFERNADDERVQLERAQANEIVANGQVAELSEKNAEYLAKANAAAQTEQIYVQQAESLRHDVDGLKQSLQGVESRLGVVQAQLEVAQANTILDLASEAVPACAAAIKPHILPTILKRELPKYTTEAKNLHVEGDISACIKVSATGAVTVLRLVDNLGHGLDQEARKSFELTVFRPARDQNDQPIEWTGTAVARFHLSS